MSNNYQSNKLSGNLQDRKSDKTSDYKSSKRSKGKKSRSKAPYRKELNRNNSTKTFRRAAEIADTATHISSSNPVEFYTKFDQFAADAANLPFATPLGTNIPFIVGKYPTEKSIPGLMAIYFSPAVGISTSFDSPINRSSIRFYTYLRSNQKASAMYDHQDLTMMMVAMDSLYMLHALGRRIYGILNSFTPVNMYYSTVMLAAMGIKPSDVRSDSQKLRAWLNTLAYNLGQYALPKGITYFDRHRWMCEGLYLDSKTTRSQTYMFVPAGFFKYKNTGASGGSCEFVEYISQTANTTKTIDEFIAYGDALLRAASNEEDFAIISGDIYNFYKGDTYSLPYLEESYNILPVYDEVVLSQIENLTYAGVPDFTTFKVSQDPSINSGAILFNPKFSGALYYNCLLNFHHDSPNSNDVIEATRLTLLPLEDTSSETGSFEFLRACGTEIPLFSRVWRIVGGNPYSPESIVINRTARVVDPDQSQPDLSVPNAFKRFGIMAQFDWAPREQVVVLAGSDLPNPAVSDVAISWDSDVISATDPYYVEMIHTACLYSLFSVNAR